MKYELASSTWNKKEIDAINKVIDKDNYTMGSFVSEFENEFAKYTQNKYTVMVNSGSSANLLAIAAMFYKSKNPLRILQMILQILLFFGILKKRSSKGGNVRAY